MKFNFFSQYVFNLLSKDMRTRKGTWPFSFINIPAIDLMSKKEKYFYMGKSMKKRYRMKIKSGGAGFRTPGLSHAKRALYH